MKLDKKLYAIFKNGKHKGNERGFNRTEAIQNYIKSSLLEEFIDDEKFIAQYKAIAAVNGIHHHYIDY